MKTIECLQLRSPLALITEIKVIIRSLNKISHPGHPGINRTPNNRYGVFG
ncbi:hypothetical protein [Thioalkalivibrio sp. ALE21]|nr:hypothetical protein [Thioalkalivibrio sp. ALE21]